MPKKITLDMVLEMGLALPNVEQSTTYGVPALKVHGKMFACPAINRSAEPNSLVVRVDFDERNELIAGDPETYYVTDHYVNYPSVLVRLNRIGPDALRDLLRMGWRFVLANAKRTTSGTRSARRAPTPGRHRGHQPPG